MNENVAAIKAAVAISSTYNGRVFDPQASQYIPAEHLLMGLKHLQGEM